MDTQLLIRKAQEGDKVAREQVINENVGLVWSIVKRFLGRGQEAEDSCGLLLHRGCKHTLRLFYMRRGRGYTLHRKKRLGAFLYLQGCFILPQADTL